MKWTRPKTWAVGDSPDVAWLNQEIRNSMTKQYIALSNLSKPPANPERPHDDPQCWYAGEAVDLSHKTPDEIEMLVALGVIEEGVPVVTEDEDELPGWNAAPVAIKEDEGDEWDSPELANLTDIEGDSPDIGED